MVFYHCRLSDTALLFFLMLVRRLGKLKVGDRVLTQTSVLSLDMQRKYNYYFLEAARLKKGQYDAAFDLYKHCLAIQARCSFCFCMKYLNSICI